MYLLTSLQYLIFLLLACFLVWWNLGRIWLNVKFVSTKIRITYYPVHWTLAEILHSDYNALTLSGCRMKGTVFPEMQSVLVLRNVCGSSDLYDTWHLPDASFSVWVTSKIWNCTQYMLNWGNLYFTSRICKINLFYILYILASNLY